MEVVIKMICESMNFAAWFQDNIYTNIFTIITVVISGLVSLAISAKYYKKGDRENVKMSVIYPIIKLLNERYSKVNYDKLCEISQSYSVKYLNATEQKLLSNLVDAYESISTYDEIKVYAKSLDAYFKYELKKNKVDLKIIPKECGDETVYEYPEGMFRLPDILEEILRKYDLVIEAYECQEEVVVVYNYFCKQWYNSNNINFFKDCSFDKVLTKTKIQKVWDKKFENVDNAKKEFLKLDIVRTI